MPSYTTIFYVTLAAWLLFEFWLFWRDRGKDRSTAGEARRIVIALVIAVSLAMNVPGLAPMFDVRRNFQVFFYVGIGLVWAGLFFRMWAVRTLGNLFSTRLIVQTGHQVVTAGPYRYLRHPSYTAALMILSGLGIALGNGISLAILLATWVIAYTSRIRSEEKMLAQFFGAGYEDYKKKSWAVIPFVW